ncbi:hypothetical protein BTH42_09480 [Burkholderia sp. SRS-W-2-2016]|uniref:hypothetical protein n=1 Tax=Burkholderia sp. SRS-W-2-2016 TaxID=1926878 RepID=UPI00094B0C6F|nr:hypothetical protein [Burkholderia sp. SRS-W-2-2016]OLL31859.1 hypothetical protein BTH42_09480 [Burkholderia sp. SRS-W-2-2016]
MRKNTCIVSMALLALVTLALSGCGADDTPLASSASSTTPAANDIAQAPTTTANAAAAILDASAPLAGTTANLGANSFGNTPDSAANFAAAASDPIAQNMQANLAADSQQIAPVMRYAPGDSASN